MQPGGEVTKVAGEKAGAGGASWPCARLGLRVLITCGQRPASYGGSGGPALSAECAQATLQPHPSPCKAVPSSLGGLEIWLVLVVSERFAVSGR